MRYLIVPLLLLAGCAHKFDDVRPGEGGVNTVIVKNEDDTEGSREAIKQATAYCKHEKQEPLQVLKESAEYFGDVDEKTYKRLRRAGKAAEDITGGVVKGGKAAEYAGAGYTVKMEFRCGTM